MYTLENLLAAEKTPFLATPNTAEIITLFEELNTHHDIALGINGIEYVHNFFNNFFLYAFTLMYLYNFKDKTKYVAHTTCPNILAINIPLAPNLKATKNIILKIIVLSADKKLPTAYFKLSPSPLAICCISDANIYETTFVAKKYLY